MNFALQWGSSKPSLWVTAKSFHEGSAGCYEGVQGVIEKTRDPLKVRFSG